MRDLARDALMRGSSKLPTAALRRSPASRRALIGTRRLSIEDVPERERPLRLQEFFEPLGVRYEADQLGYRVLIDPRRRAQKIAAVAFECGFADVSYFNRAFRRHYGVAPSDVRAQALQHPAAIDGEMV